MTLPLQQHNVWLQPSPVLNPSGGAMPVTPITPAEPAILTEGGAAIEGEGGQALEGN